MELLGQFDAEALRRGRTERRHGGRKEPALRVVTESKPDETPSKPSKTSSKTKASAYGVVIDSPTVRPRLAEAAAQSFESLKDSLHEAAGSATKPDWVTVVCSGCGKRSRVEAPVPDVRATDAAIELLLREGFGCPGTAQEIPSPRLPPTSRRCSRRPGRRCSRSSPRPTWTSSQPCSATAARRSPATSS